MNSFTVTVTVSASLFASGAFAAQLTAPTMDMEPSQVFDDDASVPLTDFAPERPDLEVASKMHVEDLHHTVPDLDRATGFLDGLVASLPTRPGTDLPDPAAFKESLEAFNLDGFKGSLQLLPPAMMMPVMKIYGRNMRRAIGSKLSERELGFTGAEKEEILDHFDAMWEKAKETIASVAEKDWSEDTPECKVTLYDYDQGRGPSKTFGPGQHILKEFKRKTTSIKVEGEGCNVRVWNSVFNGRGVLLGEGMHNKDDMKQMGARNNKIKSLDVFMDEVDEQADSSDEQPDGDATQTTVSIPAFPNEGDQIFESFLDNWIFEDYQELDVPSGEKVYITWTEDDDFEPIYEMESELAYENCDFSNARKLPTQKLVYDDEEWDGDLVAVYQVPAASKAYLAEKKTCASDNRKLTINTQGFGF